MCCALLKNMSNCYDLYMAADLLKNLAFIQMNQHMCIEHSLPWWTHGELIIKSCVYNMLFHIDWIQSKHIFIDAFKNTSQ